VLRDAGLVTAVRWLVNEQKRRNEFNVFLEFEGFEEDVRFTDAVELSAYRVIQEALNNCRKHSKAKAVWVRVEYSTGALNVSVEDNGVGFAATAKGERRPDEGLGIRALKQRIASLGGTLTLSERASRGAAVKASFPIADEAARAAI
jgi:two-component system sensor histidine kinase DegS